MPHPHQWLFSGVIATMMLLSPDQASSQSPDFSRSLAPPSFEAISDLEHYDNVIVLGNEEAAHFFQGIRFRESTAAGFRIQVEDGFVVDRIRHAPAGSIIVAVAAHEEDENGRAIPYCDEDLLPECGLMATLMENPNTSPDLSEDCLKTGGNCWEFVFANAGLDDVIKSGHLRITTTSVAIHARDDCFTDQLKSIHDRGSSEFDNYLAEINCAGPNPPSDFPVPPKGPDDTASTPSFHMQHASMLGITAEHDGLCTTTTAPDGHWSGELNPETKTLEPYGGVKLGIDYRATFLLIQDLYFHDGRVEGQMSLAVCQLGEVALRLEARPDAAIIPIWARASGPHLVMLGSWLPLVYSTTARLDLDLASSVGIELNPLLSFVSIERYTANFSASDTGDTGTTSRHFVIKPGNWNDITTSFNTTARLLPAFQINLYGTAGLFAGAELALQGSIRARGNNSTVGAKLHSSLNAGLDVRIINRRFKHTWPLSQCSIEYSIGEGVPSC